MGDKQGMPTWMRVSVHTFLSIFRLRTLDTPAPRPRCSPVIGTRQFVGYNPSHEHSTIHSAPRAGLKLVCNSIWHSTVGHSGHFPTD